MRFHTFLTQKWLCYPKHKAFTTYSNLNNNKDSIIYLIYSTKTKKCYIGETKNLQNRIQTELRNAAKVTCKHNYKKEREEFEIYMGNIGFETWSYVILQNLGHLKNNDKATRLMVEKMYIR